MSMKKHFMPAALAGLMMAAAHAPNAQAELQEAWAVAKSTPAGQSEMALEIKTDANNHAYSLNWRTWTDAAGVLQRLPVIDKVSAEGTLLWRHELNAPAGETNYYPPQYDVDANGDLVIVQSYTNVGSAGRRWSIKKFNSAGTLLWERSQLDGNILRSVSIDANGSAVVTGRVGLDRTLLKYDANGTLQWTRSLATTGNVIDVEANGTDIYHLAYLDGMVLRKFNAAGTLLWTRTLANTTVRFIGNDLAADNSGAYVYVQYIDTANAASDVILYKFASADGAQLWQNAYNPSSYDAFFGIKHVVTDGGFVYFKGRTSVGTELDAWVRQVNATTGATNWTRSLVTANLDYFVSMDAREGRLYMAGATGTTGNFTSVLQKYDQNGVLLGDARYQTAGISVNYDVAVGSNPDHVYTAYYGLDGTSNLARAQTRKYVKPNTPPVAVAGADVSAECSGAQSATVHLDGSKSYDEDGDALTYSWSGPFGTRAGAVIDVDFTLASNQTVTLTVTDSNGASATDTVLVHVVDTINPSVNAGADVTLEATNPIGEDFTLTTITASDSCSAVTVTIDYGVKPYLVNTVNMVTVTANDSTGNGASDSMLVTVQDTTPPALSPLALPPIEATGLLTFVDIGTPVIDEIFGIKSLSNNAPLNQLFGLGSTTFNWTAVDANDNTGSASQTVTVVDTIAPSLTAPGAVAAEATGDLTPVNLGAPTASDATLLGVTNDAPAAGFPLGTTTVTWTATDAAGHTASDTQAVTVSDNTPPVVTPPADINVVATAPTMTLDIGIATATDLFAPLTIGHDAPAVFPIGVTTVNWSATDPSGNTGSAAQTVTVTNPPPVANAGADQDIYLTQTAWLDASASTDFVGIVSYRWMIESAPAGSVAAIAGVDQPLASFVPDVVGSYIISLVVNNGQYDSAADSMLLTVTRNLPPSAVIATDVVSGIAPVLVNFDASQSFDTDSPLSALGYAWDFGDGNPVAVNSATGLAASHLYEIPGFYTAVLSVTDEFGNVDQAQVTIEVIAPNEPPVIKPVVTVTAEPGSLTAQFTANATDPNVDDVLTYLWDFGDGNTSTEANPLHTYAAYGVYTVTLSVADAEFTVTEQRTVVFDSPLSLNVREVKINGGKAGKVEGKIKVKSDFALPAGMPLPAAEDRVMVSVDGVVLIDVPFGAFSQDDDEPLEFEYKEKHLHMEIDYAKFEFKVSAHKLLLTDLDVTDGVDLLVYLGKPVAIAHVDIKVHSDEDDDKEELEASHKDQD